MEAMDRLEELLPARQDTTRQQRTRRGVSRRAALTAVLAGGLGVGGVGAASAYRLLGPRSAGPFDPSSIATVESARRRSGTPTQVSLTARRTQVDLGGRVVPAMTYGGSFPASWSGPRRGDLLRVEVTNQLDQPTSVYWHGLAIRNDMDGVPWVTTAAITAGGSARYEFVVPDPGTYWFPPPGSSWTGACTPR